MNTVTGSSRIRHMTLPTIEGNALADAAMQHQTLLQEEGHAPDGEVYRALSRVIASRVGLLAPSLDRALTMVQMRRIDALYVRGLSSEPSLAPLLLLAITYRVGMAFNYTTQNEGKLVMELRPDPGSADNTNSTANEFRPHTDDAAVPRSFRVEWISLLGVKNPPNTLTGYAPIDLVIPDLSMRNRQVLSDKRFSVRVPLSFKLGDDLWTGPRAVLSRSPEGLTEIAWPSYATRVLDPLDDEAERALAELESAVERHMTRVALDSECLLVFNNLRGVHMRSKVGPGDRLVYRTYAKDSLEPLRAKTGISGQIFDPRLLLDL